MNTYTPPREEPPQGAVPPLPEGRVPVRMPSARPLVTYTLIFINVLVYVLQYVSQFWFGYDYMAALGMKVNELILQGEVWRFFTPMFLHGSLLHIGFNMYALYIIGPNLERFYGRQRFLALYLLSGIAGNIASFVFTPNPSLGSSTAIFGILGAEAILLYRNREIFGTAAQRGLSRIISIAAINLFIGLSPGIDNWGHIGGLAGGVLFSWLAGPLLQLEGVYPSLALVDQREPRDVMVAALLFAAFLVLLAGGLVLTAGG